MRRLFLGLGAATLLALAAPSAAQTPGLEAEVRDLNRIEFHQFEDGSRVLIGTNEPAHFRVDTSREKMIVVVLENARVPLFNNTRALETRYFDSPVLSVQAKVIEGPSQSVNVEIRLRRKVPFKQAQNDTLITLDFPRS